METPGFEVTSALAQAGPYRPLAERALRDEPLAQAEALALLASPDADLAPILWAAFAARARHFARRVKVPALVGVGLVDTVCPAEGVLATTNLFQGPKKIIVMPRSGHGGEGPGHKAYYAVYGAFLEEHKKK